MVSSQIWLKLPSELIERCHKYGETVVEDYAQGKNLSSLRVSSHGAQYDAVLQAKAKMAECAFAVWAMLDPLQAIKWGREIDPGYDVLYGRALIDVKSIGSNDRYLIWPVNKTSFYDTKKFTAMVLVRENEPDFYIERWIDKLSFLERHKITDEDHRLTAGTWYMEIDELFGIESLAAYGSLFYAKRTA